MTPKDKAAAETAAAAKQRDADAAALKQKEADAAKANDLTSLQGALQNLTTQMAEMGGRVNILAEQRHNPTPAPATRGFQRTVSLEQIDKAHDEGDTKLATRLQLQYNTESTQEIMQGVNEKIAGLEHSGTSMIADVVQQQVSAGLPHYQKYKKEIDEFLAKAPASARTQPEMYKWAHDAIVGRHHAELVQEEVDKAVRKIMDGGSGYVPGSGRGEGDPAAGDLTIESVYGEDSGDIKRILKSTNQTLEQYARRRKFPDAQAYLKHVKEFREKEAQREAM